MKKSIKELFAALEGGRPAEDAGEKQAKTDAESGASAEGAKQGAAERVGRALLERLGGVSGMSEEELAEAIIAVWSDPDSLTGGEEQGEKRTYEEPSIELSLDDEGETRGRIQPFGEQRRMPAPLRSGGVQAAPIDYDDLTTEQFMRLKKQLRKAAADGKRVRL